MIVERIAKTFILRMLFLVLHLGNKFWEKDIEDSSLGNLKDNRGNLHTYRRMTTLVTYVVQLN